MASVSKPTGHPAAEDKPDQRKGGHPVAEGRAAEDVDVVDRLQRVLVDGDLDKLDKAGRAAYYTQLCESLGLSPWSLPFGWLRFQGRLVLYATKGATDQLRAKHNITQAAPLVRDTDPANDLIVYTCTLALPTGRQDSDVAAVSVAGLKGDALANAIMKCCTKAKRRTTLSLTGLGNLMDETEVHTLTGAQILHTGPDFAPQDADAPRSDSGPGNSAQDEKQIDTTAAFTQVISKKQRARLFAIAAENQVSHAQLAEWLREVHGITDTAKIRRAEYEGICAQIADETMTDIAQEDAQ